VCIVTVDSVNLFLVRPTYATNVGIKWQIMDLHIKEIIVDFSSIIIVIPDNWSQLLVIKIMLA